MGVAIDLIGMPEDVQIADEVARHEPDEDESGDGHDDLSADGGGEQRFGEVHGRCAGTYGSRLSADAAAPPWQEGRREKNPLTRSKTNAPL